MIVALVRDLLFATRIGDAAASAGREFRRVDDLGELPPAASVELLFVDWTQRGPGWGDGIRTWCGQAPEWDRPRVVLYGPHGDLAAHVAAREAGLGPMLARSTFVNRLSVLITRGR